MNDELDLNRLLSLHAKGGSLPYQLLRASEFDELWYALPKLIAIAQAVNAARADKGLPPVTVAEFAPRES